jgi:hypothetical protein
MSKPLWDEDELYDACAAEDKTADNIDGILRVVDAWVKKRDRTPELLAMLRELEWGGESEHWQGVSACLFCRGDEPGERHPGGDVDHKPDCRLAALLREVEGG